MKMLYLRMRLATGLTLTLLCFNLVSVAQTHTVDPLTGAMNLDVPIFTLADGDITFPIGLFYRTNGVSVNSTSGLFGHGWSTSADAAISREVRSLPDDFLGTSPDIRKGWLHGDMGVRIKNFSINTDNNESTCSDEVANFNFLNAFGYHEDTEPDVFHVSAPGLSLQFYFDENKAIQVVPLTDVQVTYTSDPVSGQILSFTIVDPKGYSYVFAAIEKTKDWIKPLSPVPSYYGHQYNLYKIACTYATSWKLTQINSPVYGQINLNYRNQSHESDPTVNGGVSLSLGETGDEIVFKNPVELTDYWNQKSEVFKYDVVFSQKVLESISSPSHTVEFIPTTKRDSTDIITTIKIVDNRTTTPALVKEYKLSYTSQVYYETPEPESIVVGSRSSLTSIQEKTGTSTLPALSFEYYGQVSLPQSNSNEKDAWGFFKSPANSYWETLTAGSLKRIQYPTGGYVVVFYQPHDFLDPSTGTVKTGGGIRVKKIVSHDGLSSSSDITEEYEYMKANGQSSGKLVFDPKNEMTTVKIKKVFGYQNAQGNYVSITDPVYRKIDSLITLGFVTGPAGKYFNMTAPFEPGDNELVNGSHVAYERVTRKTQGAGRTIYEFELPAMAGDLTASSGEWDASISNIARASTGGSGCYETGTIPRGAWKFPYPRNPNYSFARGLLKKVTDENESGIKVREEIFTYQRVYGGSGIKKIYGITLEELPTYYYNGSSYTNSKMFLYGKYPVFTDVKVELTEKKEILYYSTDLTKKSETTTTFHYESANHKELTKVVTTNSDGTQSVTRFNYVKDYSITSPTGANASNIVALKSAHRNEVVESLSSTIEGAVEKFTAGTLFLFQDISSKIYPYQVLTFNSVGGLSTFSPSAITGGTMFGYDANYDLKSTITAFSTTAMPKEQVGKDRVVHATVWAFGGTLPIMQITNAKLNEVGYANFDGSHEVDFLGWATADKVGGRSGGTSILMTSALPISRVISNNGAQQYIFSCWVRPTTSSGNLTLKLRNGSTNFITPVEIPFEAGAAGTFQSIVVNASGLPSSFTVSLETSATVALDDVAFYPSHAQVSFHSYSLPFGVESATNMSGRSIFYSYDEWGRVITVRDQDNNILKKTNYQVKP